MPMSNRTITAASGLGAAFLAALSVAAVGWGDSTVTPVPKTAEASQPASSMQGPAAPTEVADELARDFALFRRPVTKDDYPDVGRAIAETQGLARALTRRVASPAPEVQAWIAPTATGVCLLMLHPGYESAGGGCSDTYAPASAGELFQAQVDGKHVDVIGLVPDGVSSVTITLDDGSVEQLSVRENVYAARFEHGTEEVRFEGPDGGRVVVDARAPLRD
jgi:hypothetical protein